MGASPKQAPSRSLFQHPNRFPPIVAAPTTPSVTPCSPPSRRGLPSAERVEPKERRPALTAAARGVTELGQVGTKKRPPGRTKKLTSKQSWDAPAASRS